MHIDEYDKSSVGARRRHCIKHESGPALLSVLRYRHNIELVLGSNRTGDGGDGRELRKAARDSQCVAHVLFILDYIVSCLSR